MPPILIAMLYWPELTQSLRALWMRVRTFRVSRLRLVASAVTLAVLWSGVTLLPVTVPVVGAMTASDFVAMAMWTCIGIAVWAIFG